MAFEDEDHWPANPWQAQADAQLLQLQRSVLLQEVGGSPCGVLHRLHDLEGQLAAAEAKIASQSYELQQVRQELEATRRTRKLPAASHGVEELQEKNEFLQALMARFERKVMLLEEENAKLTVEARQRRAAPAPTVLEAATQAEDGALYEVEGQLALVEGNLRRKEHELHEVKDALKNQKRNWDSFLSAAKGRTPAQLVSEIESLQSRNGFLSDLVNRFEDKTMVLERHNKSLAASEKELQDALSLCRKEQEESAATFATQQQQLREEAKGSALLLRDTKREHNKKVQDLLRQLAEARSSKANARKASPAPCCHDREIAELKELNGQLVERLGKERTDHAETRARLDLSFKEKETLELRTSSLASQLIQLADLNEDLEEQLQRR